MSPVTVNADNFVRAESDLAFTRMAGDAKGGPGTWVHYREPAPLDHQLIIRLNRDTLYSTAIVDISEGGTLTLPDPGDRYLSVMVVNQDHYIPRVFSEPGEHRLERAELGTDFVLLACRILVDPSDPSDVAAVNALQDGLGVATVSRRPFVCPDYDQATYQHVRKALLDLAPGLPDFRGAFGKQGEVNPIRHLIGSASAWGGLPEYEANYLNINPGLPVGEYRFTLKDVPVDAFWSVSLYNADGYFEPNELGVNNINSVTAVHDPDGGVTVSFGTKPSGRPNYLPIMEGWNYMIRMYRPRPEALDGSWAPPAVEPVS